MLRVIHGNNNSEKRLTSGIMELIYILRCKITNNFSYMQICKADFAIFMQKKQKKATFRLLMYSLFYAAEQGDANNRPKERLFGSGHNGVFMVLFESFDGVLEHCAHG